jgi:hypothetical protein
MPETLLLRNAAHSANAGPAIFTIRQQYRYRQHCPPGPSRLAEATDGRAVPDGRQGLGARLHRLLAQEGGGVGTDIGGPEGSRRSTTFGPANINLGRRLILCRSESTWRLPRMIRLRYFSDQDRAH